MTQSQSCCQAQEHKHCWNPEQDTKTSTLTTTKVYVTGTHDQRQNLNLKSILTGHARSLEHLVTLLGKRQGSF